MGTSGMSRRDFLRIGGGAGAGLVFIGRIGGQLFQVPVAAAAIPGGSLDPAGVPKYVMPLLIPPVMPRAGTTTMPGGKPVDLYEISVRQFAEQILPTGFRPTEVAMIEPVPDGKVRGAGFYLQFLDNRDWAGFMRQGREAGRHALTRLGRTWRRSAGSRTSVGKRHA